ncbi:MAG TPA: hypothetical protein VMW80_07050 [Candidatus Dormibacteraeota bacterium]|nr:hypothetical protein [Candidatus Dormibacteraeota bacterium]
MDITALVEGPVPSDPTTKPRRVLRRVGTLSLLLAFYSLLARDVGDFLVALVVGVVCLAPWAVARWNFTQVRRSDLASAAALGQELRAHQVPTPVTPTRLSPEDNHLEPGEQLYVDGVKAQFLSFYGDPVVIQSGMFIAIGSPIAWAFTIIGNLMFWSHARKKRKAAAPRWRDPEPAQVWVTDRRFIVHALKGGQSWLQLRYETLGPSALDRDGIVLQIPNEPLPAKLRVRAPGVIYVLYRYFATGQVFTVTSPWWYGHLPIGAPGLRAGTDG